jgi:Ca-activated chloride channel family protein
MTFAWPLVLWLLAVPAALLIWEATRRIRAAAAPHPKILRAEAGTQALRLGRGPDPVRRLQGWLAVGLALAVLALARPQWGRIDEPSFDQSREILIALDLSRSMMTPDVKPTRLDRAKLLIQSLLDHLSGERVGLIDFSGTAFLQAPLSADYEILGEFLPSLGPDFMPEGGTNYGALLDTAAAAFSEGSGADRYLIILSDGGATDEGWRGHLRPLTDKGVRVIGLGLGTAAGALIPDGAGGFVKDENGAVVMARLESETLRELADKTGGAYRDASGWIDLPALLRATVEAGRKGRFVEKNQVRYVERFQWFLAPALACLLFSFWREFPVRPRPRDLRAAPAAAPGAKRAAVAAALLAAALLAARSRAQNENDAAPLAHIVGRISAAPQRTASDWAEFSSETVAWGQRLQAAHQPVPEGAVRDGLDAVDAGANLDPRAADWAKLRAELRRLQQKPPPDKPPPPPPQQNQQQNSGGGQQESDPQNNAKQPQNAQPQPAQPQNSPGSPPKPNAENSLGSAGQPPPPSSGGTQKVGGRPERSEREPGSSDPALEASIEKLDQIRDQDSPAELFQMIQNNEPHPPPKGGKNW